MAVATDWRKRWVHVCVGCELVFLVESDDALGYFEERFFDTLGEGGREGEAR